MRLPALLLACVLMVPAAFAAAPKAGARPDHVADRDCLAAGLQLDPTLIATRTQLVQLARDPSSIEEVLLPWQAKLIKAEPAWRS